MPKKGKGRKPEENNGKNDQLQEKMSDKLKMLIAFVLSCIGWNKDKKEGKPAITVEKTTDSKHADKNVYRIAVRADASISTDEVQDSLLAMMTTEAPKATEKAESEGHSPIYGLVMSILHKLQRLDRYKLMEIVEEKATGCILAVMPKQVHLNYTNNDLKKAMRMAVNGKDFNARIQSRVEANLTMQLLALTGEIKVGMDTETPSIIVVYAPRGDNTSFHNIKLVASMYLVNNNTQMNWKSGKREHRAFKGRKEVSPTAINKMLKKAKFTLKGENKPFQIAFNRKTNSYDWKNAADNLEKAKAAGAIPANITFKRVWTQDGNQPVQDIGFGTVAGILTSMTNGTNKGKTSHIKVETLRNSFVNISLKRLLAAHPTEMDLLNEENQNLTTKLRLLLGLKNYKMPAVYTTQKENWSSKDKDDLMALQQSGVIRAWKENDVDALLKASKHEPVAHQELNRWYAHTGIAHAVEECEFTVDAEATMLDIVGAETEKKEKAPQAQ